MLKVLKNCFLNYRVFPKIPSYYRDLCSLVQKKNIRTSNYLCTRKEGLHKLPFDSNRPFVDLSAEEGLLRSVLPAISEEIIEEYFILKDNSELRDRCVKLIDYNQNIETKFLYAPLIFLHNYKLLEKPSLLSDEKLKQACILAWCHKLIHSSLIIVDDIVDKSEIRYNKTAWYQLTDIGKDAAIVDAAFLLNGAIFLLQNHLRSHPHEYSMHKHFLRAHALLNLCGISEMKKFNINELEKYQTTVDTKFYIFNLLSTAMFLTNVTDGYLHEVGEEICNDISRFLKIQVR
uniref:Terpene synthase n=1 Tax=Phyllotreta armoraciae TaxID=1553667 RepID=A0A140AZ73_9CUCU|nr:terpene synthase [Phyllotreta armoraciae]